MPVLSNNQLITSLLGSKIYFKPDPIGSTSFPMIELGILPEPATPELESQRQEVRDPFYSNAVVSVLNPQVDERYRVTPRNISLQNMAMQFLANPPADNARTGASSTDVAQGTDVVVGRTDGGGYHRIVDASGNPVLNLASVDAVKYDSPATTLVLNEDYIVEDLNIGLIRLIPGGATNSLPEAGVLASPTVTYTTSTLPAGYRVLSPQSRKVIDGDVLIATRECPGVSYLREGRANLSPDSPTFGVNNLSNTAFTLLILVDTLGTCTQTFGTLTQIAGDLPSNVRL